MELPCPLVPCPLDPLRDCGPDVCVACLGASEDGPPDEASSPLSSSS